MNKILVSALSLAAAVSINASILAKAGDITVTDEDIAPLMQQDAMHSMMGVNMEQNISAESKKNMINNVLKYKLLVKEAKASGITKDVEYQKQLDTAADSIAFSMWQQKKFNNIKVLDMEAKKYYDENPDAFTEPDQIKAKHILVESEKEAKDIIAKLKNLKDKKLADEFAKIAGEKSKDPTAKQNGGDLGFFSKNQMVEPFANAAFALKDGEISKEPVKTQFGYHVILKEETKKSQKVSFEAVKEMIKKSLKQQKFQEEITQEAEKAFEKAKVEYIK